MAYNRIGFGHNYVLGMTIMTQLRPSMVLFVEFKQAQKQKSRNWGMDAGGWSMEQQLHKCLAKRYLNEKDNFYLSQLRSPVAI